MVRYSNYFQHLSNVHIYMENYIISLIIQSTCFIILLLWNELQIVCVHSITTFLRSDLVCRFSKIIAMVLGAVVINVCFVLFIDNNFNKYSKGEFVIFTDFEFKFTNSLLSNYYIFDLYMFEMGLAWWYTLHTDK